MESRQAIAFIAAVLLALPSCHRTDVPSKAKVTNNEEKVVWPPLPATGFITGRSATNDDIAKGDAVFSLNASEPMKIEIPQYAYHIDEQTGKKSPGIIVQAERTSDGMELLAMQSVADGGELVGLLREFKLLGKTPPTGD